MKNQLIKQLLTVVIFLLGGIAWCPNVRAEVWLKDIPVDRLQELYKNVGYDGMKGYLMLPSYKYPEIFLKNFPNDYNKIVDEKERNALFIKIIAPLALKINQDLLQERKPIAEIEKKFKKGEQLSDDEIELLEKKAQKYDVFTRLKDGERYGYIITELLNRIDQIPPSILITAAAIETNWGTSRIVKEANSLYKMLVWHTKDGLKPVGETEDDTYRIKMYPDIYASIQDFALKINSHVAFAPMRNLRRERRERTSNLSGMMLAPYTYGTSELKNYAGIFDYTMAYYELMVIDKSTLDSTMITNDKLADFEKYVTKM